MKFWTWGAMAVAVGAIGSTLGACGGSTSTGSGGAGGAMSSSSTSSSSGAMGKGSECTAKGTMCAPCCQDVFMAENQVLFFTYVFPKCACDPAPDGGMAPTCAAECAANVCMVGMNPDQTCADCVNKKVIQATPTGQCYTDSVAACMADPKCSPLLGCVSTFCK